MRHSVAHPKADQKRKSLSRLHKARGGAFALLVANAGGTLVTIDFERRAALAELLAPVPMRAAGT